MLLVASMWCLCTYNSRCGSTDSVHFRDTAHTVEPFDVLQQNVMLEDSMQLAEPDNHLGALGEFALRLRNRTIGQLSSSESTLALSNVHSLSLSLIGAGLLFEGGLTTRMQELPPTWEDVDRVGVSINVDKTRIVGGNFTQHIGAGLLSASPFAQPIGISSKVSIRQKASLRLGGSSYYKTGSIGVGVSSSIDLPSTEFHGSLWQARATSDDSKSAEAGLAASVIHENVATGLQLLSFPSGSIGASLFGIIALAELTLEAELAIAKQQTGILFHTIVQPTNNRLTGWLSVGVNGFQNIPEISRRSSLSRDVHSLVAAGIEYATRRERFSVRCHIENRRPVLSRTSWPHTRAQFFVGYKWKNSTNSLVRKGEFRILVEDETLRAHAPSKQSAHAYLKADIQFPNQRRISTSVQCKWLPQSQVFALGMYVAVDIVPGLTTGAVALNIPNEQTTLYAATYALPSYTLLHQSSHSLLGQFVKYHLDVNDVGISAFLLNTHQRWQASHLKGGLYVTYQLGR